MSIVKIYEGIVGSSFDDQVIARHLEGALHTWLSLYTLLPLMRFPFIYKWKPAKTARLRSSLDTW